MKRCDDFKSFMAQLRPLEESILSMPDLPNGVGLDYVETVNQKKPFADNPYSQSDLRENGLMLWDSVYISGPTSVDTGFKNRRDLSTLRSINSCWEITKDTLNMLGRPDGIHYLRPKGEFILDMLNDDIRMLQGAHIITHRMEYDGKSDDYTFGQTSDVFLRNLIKMFLARKYNLTINVHPDNDAVDSFSHYGIEVFGSSELRAPILMVPAAEGRRLKRDETVVTVLGSVGIEAHSKNVQNPESWKETDKWACMPTLIALAGWECVDYVMHAERIELLGDPFYAVPCSDLQGMDGLPEILDVAEKMRGKPALNDACFNIPDWFDTDDFKEGLSKTPILPCPMCIRVNTSANGAIRKPRGRSPRKPFKDIEGSTVPDLKEWVEYVKFMRNCITVGRTATTYALGSVTTAKRRNSEFKSIAEIRRRIFSLEGRYVRKLTKGYVSEAEAIDLEIRSLKEKLTC